MGIENKISSIRSAVKVNFLGKYINIFIQLLYGAILSRILTPKDFGIVAVVTVFTSFFSLVANMGIGPAVIQNKDIDKSDINNIYSLTVYVGLIISILFSLFSIPLSIFYSNRVYISIGILLSISLFLNTINIVPNALLLKSHRFKLVSIRLVIISIVTAIPTILLALFGFKYYSIVIHSILVALLTYLWNYSTTKPKFNIKLNKKGIDKIREFSTYQMGFSVINYFARNLDNLLIGKYISNDALGYYDKSYKLMLYPVQNLTHVITPVLHPILSSNQNNPEYIYKQYIKIVKILSLIGVFISTISYFAAEEIILILYGNQWSESILSFKILSFSIFFQMTVSSAGSIYQSIGNTKMMFNSSIIFTIVTIVCIFIGVHSENINIVALFVLISLIFKFFIDYYFLVNKAFGYSSRKFFNNFVPDFLIFLFLFITMAIATKVNINNVLLSLFYKLVICTIIFVLCLLIFKQHKYLKQIIKKV